MTANGTMEHKVTTRRANAPWSWTRLVGAESVRNPTDPAAALQVMRDAGVEPKGSYPGHKDIPWPSVCMICGRDVAPRLGNVRQGHGGCRYCSKARGEDHHKWTGDDATYLALHLRVRKTRGRASTYACVDCGGRADEWSYDGGSDQERVSDDSDPYAPRCKYSLDVDAYSPRCKKCHGAYDSSRRADL